MTLSDCRTQLRAIKRRIEDQEIAVINGKLYSTGINSIIMCARPIPEREINRKDS